EPLFALVPEVLTLIAWVGAFTALLAATMACVEGDIKRVLAYSTVSQLGYMMAAAGAGASPAGFLHLLTHGLFKALLFLAAGAVDDARTALAPRDPHAARRDPLRPRRRRDPRGGAGMVAAAVGRAGRSGLRAGLGDVPAASDRSRPDRGGADAVRLSRAAAIR